MLVLGVIGLWPIDKFNVYQMRLTLTLSLVFIYLLSNAQSVGLTTVDSTYRIHFTSEKGKWSIGGHKTYNHDSVLQLEFERGYSPKDESVFYEDRTWYFPNGDVARTVSVDFRKRRKARIVDKQYIVGGKLSRSVTKKSKRRPEQIHVEDVFCDYFLSP